MSNRLDLRLNKGMSTSNYDIEFNQGDTFFDSIFIYFSTWLAFSAAMTGARSGDEMSGRLRGVIIPQLTFRNTQVLSNLINSNSVTDLRFTVNMVRPQQPSGRRVGTMKLFEFLGQQTLGHSFEMAKSAILAKSQEDLVNNIISVISDKTGYPIDLLDPDLDMEADLGIDTVKQVEIFGVIREEYSIEREEGLSIANYPTINSVASYFIV